MTVTSAETLSSAPALYDLPAGRRAWSVLLTKTGDVHVQGDDPAEASGSAGTVALKVKGYDTKGGSQSTTVTLHDPLGRRTAGRWRTAADRTGPHRTAPDRPVLLRTGTIEP